MCRIKSLNSVELIRCGPKLMNNKFTVIGVGKLCTGSIQLYDARILKLSGSEQDRRANFQRDEQEKMLKKDLGKISFRHFCQ